MRLSTLFVHLILAIMATTLTACLDDPGDTYITNEGDVYEGDTIVNYNDDDDSASTDDDSTPTDDDDSATSEMEASRVEISFTTAWSSLGPTYVSPGGTAGFGTYVLRVTGEPGNTVEIRTKGIIITTKDEPADIFQPWGAPDATGVSIEEHIESVSLIHPVTGQTIQGPYEDIQDNPGFAVFEDNFQITIEDDGETYFPLRFVGTFTDTEPSGTMDGFAILWETSSFEVINPNTGVAVDTQFISDNGNWANPTVQVWLQSSEEPEPEVTVSMTGSAPVTVTRGENEAFFGTYEFTLEDPASLKHLTELFIVLTPDDDGNPSNSLGNDLDVEDHISACWLSMGSTISNIEAPDSSGEITFGGLSQDIWDGTQISLYCETTTSSLGSGDTDLFVPLVPTGGVIMEDVNTGNDVVVEFVNGVGTLNENVDFYVSVIDHGILHMSLDPGTPTGSVLTAGGFETAAIYRAFSEFEPIEISEFSLQVLGDPSFVDFVTISYLNAVGNTLTSTTFLYGGIVQFSGLSMAVEENVYANITVDLGLLPGTPDGTDYSFVLNSGIGSFRATGLNTGFVFNIGDLIPASPIASLTVSTPSYGLVWSLAAGSPQGGSVPWSDTPILDVNGTAPFIAGNQPIDTMILEISSTDNASSWWNRCFNADANTIGITKDGGLPVNFVFEVYSMNGLPCSLDPNTKVGTIEVSLQGEIILAGTTATYEFTYDAYGASSVQDDAIRVDLIEVNGVTENVFGGSLVF